MSISFMSARPTPQPCVSVHWCGVFKKEPPGTYMCQSRMHVMWKLQCTLYFSGKPNGRWPHHRVCRVHPQGNRKGQPLAGNWRCSFEHLNVGGRSSSQHEASQSTLNLKRNTIVWFTSGHTLIEELEELGQNLVSLNFEVMSVFLGTERWKGCYLDASV